MCPRATALESAEAAPEQHLLAQERAERVKSLLAELPETQADALRLRFFGGLKFQEIADTMRCSLATAKNRVRWGLLRLSEMLQTGADAGVLAPGAIHGGDE